MTVMLDQMIEQEKPDMTFVSADIARMRDHIDKLDEAGLFRYVYRKLASESVFDEQVGLELMLVLHSPIKFLNWLLKEDKELAESNFTQLLYKRLSSDTQERTVLRFLLKLMMTIRRCAERHEVEHKSLMEIFISSSGP